MNRKIKIGGKLNLFILIYIINDSYKEIRVLNILDY